jgi:aryl-alcohol dehydrogenase-like predicted oxidoreductase
METLEIGKTGVVTSRIGLGTWAIGGWMWGGTDEAESIRAIRAALDLGITLIDTAPAYGFGRSEELRRPSHRREWRPRSCPDRDEGRPRMARRSGVPQRIGPAYSEGSGGLAQRLRTDRIDVYHVHWPDPLVPDRGNGRGAPAA